MSGRHDLLLAVRRVVTANLPEGFEEVRHYQSMTTWAVPLDRAPASQRGPLPVAALGERMQYVSLYLMGMYYDPRMSEWLDRAWARSGCPLDRGKVCVRLRRLDEVPLDVVARAVAYHSVDDLVAAYERRRAR